MYITIQSVVLQQDEFHGNKSGNGLIGIKRHWDALTPYCRDRARHNHSRRANTLVYRNNGMMQ